MEFHETKTHFLGVILALRIQPRDVRSFWEDETHQDSSPKKNHRPGEMETFFFQQKLLLGCGTQIIFSRGSRTKPLLSTGILRAGGTSMIHILHWGIQGMKMIHIHSLTDSPVTLQQLEISHFPLSFLRKKANKLQQIKEDAEICKRSWRVPREVIFMVIMAFGRNAVVPDVLWFSIYI